jgi:pimeloyl-ACP methyl ester carboxylesterase
MSMTRPHLLLTVALVLGCAAASAVEVPPSPTPAHPEAPMSSLETPAVVAAGTVSLVATDGGVVAIEDHGGAGPLVLAVPGLGDLRSEYRFLAASLKDAGYRVVTMDLRGHGGSSTGFASYEADAAAGDVVAVLRHLNAGKATVVGTSFGAAAVAAAAAAVPDLVERVVLIGPFVRDEPKSAAITLMLSVMFHGPWKTAAWMAYLDSLYTTHKPHDHQAQLALVRANLDEPGRFEAVRTMMFAGRSATAPTLSSVKAPVLIVMGSKDPDFKVPADEANAIAALLTSTKTTTVLIDGAGHYPHAESPAPTATAVLSFLQAAH